MIRLLAPFVLLILIAWGSVRLSIGRTRRALDARAQLLVDPALDVELRKLADALGIGRITLRVLPDDSVNGFADADGRIYLTQGFLAARARAEVSDAELASVVAHELGHVAQGHMRRRMIDVAGHNVVLGVAAMLVQRLVPVIGPWLVHHAGAALMARLSRRDEFEADAWAAALLIKAGIGTAPQKSLLSRLGGLAGGGDEGVGGPAWLRSHPPAMERIRAIEANEARWGA